MTNPHCGRPLPPPPLYLFQISNLLPNHIFFHPTTFYPHLQPFDFSLPLSNLHLHYFGSVPRFPLTAFHSFFTTSIDLKTSQRVNWGRPAKTQPRERHHHKRAAVSQGAGTYPSFQPLPGAPQDCWLFCAFNQSPQPVVSLTSTHNNHHRQRSFHWLLDDLPHLRCFYQWAWSIWSELNTISILCFKFFTKDLLKGTLCISCYPLLLNSLLLPPLLFTFTFLLINVYQLGIC